MKNPVRAFTLVETIMVMAFLGGVAIALSGTTQMFYQQNAYTFESVAALDNARNFTNAALKNIREMSYGEDGSYPISAVSTSSITFYAEADGDTPVEKVRIYKIGDTLYRVVTNAGGNPPSYTGQAPATTSLAKYVRNATNTPVFRYYDGTGVEQVAPFDLNAIASVEVRIDADINPNRAPEIFTLRGTVNIRNLKNPFE